MSPKCSDQWHYHNTILTHRQNISRISTVLDFVLKTWTKATKQMIILCHYRNNFLFKASLLCILMQNHLSLMNNNGDDDNDDDYDGTRR